MKFLVALKQVPRLDRVRFTEGLNRIVREDGEGITNPLDLVALKVALALRAQHGGEVVAVTMGPPPSRQVLTDAVARGADRGIHLLDARFAGADTLATARALAKLFVREQGDLFLFGRSTLDGGTAQTPPQVAEFAGVEQLTHAWEIQVDQGTVQAWCEDEAGRWLGTVSLPAVVSVESMASAAAADAGVRRVIRPRSLEFKSSSLMPENAISECSADELGGDETGYGIRGSGTYVQRVVPMPVARTPVRVGCREAARIIERTARAAIMGATDAPPRPFVQAERGRALWVLTEVNGDTVHPTSFEGLACAARVAEEVSANVVAVVIGECDEHLARRLGAHGADTVLVACSPHLGSYNTAAYTAALAELLSAHQPLAVIAPWSARGRDYMPRVAARLGLGMTGDFVGLEVSPRSGEGRLLDLVWLKPAWAGTVQARVVARTVPALGTLRPGAIPALPARVGGAGNILRVALTLPGQSRPDCAAEAAPTQRQPLAEDMSVDMARVLLCVGASLSRKAVSQLRGVAAERGWALGGTAAAVATGLIDPQSEVSIFVTAQQVLAH